MWYLDKIPKIAHFYWGNKTLPYLRYLTVYSFHKFNPDWEIRFYYPKFFCAEHTWKTHEQKYKFIGKDYYPELKKLPIKFIEINMATLGLRNDISAVYKSDYLRWYLLGTEGGLWSDMDILYFKSMDNISNNDRGNKNTDTLVCINRIVRPDKTIHHHSIGFMLASKDNIYYKSIWNKAKTITNPEKYQSLGILLSQQFGIKIPSIKSRFPNINIQNIPSETVYAYHARILGQIYAFRNADKFTDNTIGLHWYAGHPVAGEYINKINHTNFLAYTNILGQTIKKVLNG